MDVFLISSAFCSASLGVLVVAAGMDLKDRRIPDEAAIAIAMIGLTQGLLIRPGSLWLSFAIAAIVFCGLAVASHHRIIGGGDVKLISAVTLLVPPAQVGPLLVDIALAGGALACLYLSAGVGLKALAPVESAPVARRTGGLAVVLSAERRRIAAGAPMPYALAILGGVCLYAAHEIASCSSALSCSP